MAEASAEALKNAASNDSGAMMGFMGMNMANNAGANLMGAVGNTGEVQKEEREVPTPGSLFQKNEEVESSKEEETKEEPKEKEETSAEGNEKVEPKFCPECGTPTNGGNFCVNCGYKLK